MFSIILKLCNKNLQITLQHQIISYFNTFSAPVKSINMKKGKWTTFSLFMWYYFTALSPLLPFATSTREELQNLSSLLPMFDCFKERPGKETVSEIFDKLHCEVSCPSYRLLFVVRLLKLRTSSSINKIQFGQTGRKLLGNPHYEI